MLNIACDFDFLISFRLSPTQTKLGVIHDTPNRSMSLIKTPLTVRLITTSMPLKRIKYSC